MKTVKYFLTAIILSSLLSFNSFGQGNNNFEISKNLDIYTTLFRELNANYVDEINPGDLMQTGIESMLESLDPYTVYFEPDRVSDLILCSTNFGGPNHVPVTPEAWQVLSDTTSDPLTRFTNGLKVSTAPGWADANPDIVQEWVSWRVSNPLDMAGYQAQMAIGLGLIPVEASFEGKLDQISLPTLIISGEYDKVVPPANANLLQEKIASSEEAIIPNAGHFFPIEVPEIASQIIIKFLT